MNFRHILGALALIASATTAHAQVSVHASTVDLTALNDYSYYPPSFSLLSDQNGIVKFAMTSFGQASGWATDWYANGDNSLETFNLSLHSGYKLTGFSVTGQFHGQTYVFDSNSGGSATNHEFIGASISDEPWGQAYAAASSNINNLNGHQNMYLGASGFALTGNKALQLNGSMQVEAIPSSVCGDWGCREERSFSSIQLENPVLTLHTQAVPEPETYAMMGVGLLLLGVVARRRKQG